MGIADKAKDLRRLSRRLSQRVGAIAARNATGHADRHPEADGDHEDDATRKERAPSGTSEVSDVEHSAGGALRESNALNEDGLRIVNAIAKELAHRAAEEQQPSDGKRDAFSTGRVPSISLADYMCRLTRYVNMWRGHAGGRESAGVRAAVLCLLYLERLSEKSDGAFSVNCSNVHRLCAAGVLAAVKWTEDRAVSAEWWGRVAGVPKAEVLKLESTFVDLLEFELFVDEKVYERTLAAFCE